MEKWDLDFSMRRVYYMLIILDSLQQKSLLQIMILIVFEMYVKLYKIICVQQISFFFF